MTLESFPTNPVKDPRQVSVPLLGLGEASLHLQATYAAPEPTVRRWRAFALLVVAYFMTSWT